MKVNLEKYKSDIKNTSEKYMVYAVGKGYGDLNMAKSLNLDELYEAYQALVLFTDEQREK